MSAQRLGRSAWAAMLVAMLIEFSCDDSGGARAPEAGGTDGPMPVDASPAEMLGPDAALQPDVVSSPETSAPDTGDLAGGQSCFPPCLRQLFQACVPSGACTRTSGVARLTCFANGVKIRHDGVSDMRGGLGYVTLPDGMTPCYRMAAGPQMVIYQDGQGKLVATMSFPSAQSQKGTVMCEGDATIHEIDFGAPECAGSRSGYAGETAMTCSPGACAVPPTPR